jgi:uncharacterized membrane protein
MHPYPPEAAAPSAVTTGAASPDASTALITNDAVILGMLIAILGLVFWSSHSSQRAVKRFYQIVPVLLMCYFLPSLLTLGRIVEPSHSALYSVASRYLLPASLILLTLGVDLREIARLGPKALIMFLTGTCGVILGGPLAILVVRTFAPELVGGTGPDAVWRGMTTIAGSWIGGGANQIAMREIFRPSDALFSVMVTIDILVAELWMIFLLLGIGKKDRLDRFFRADAASIERLEQNMTAFASSVTRNPTTTDLMTMLAIAFGGMAISHALADLIAPWVRNHAPSLRAMSLDSEFFWLIILATTIGIALSMTRARNYEGAGASKIGTVFIYVLVATIGMHMDLSAIIAYRGLFLVGLIWMAVHVGLLFLVGYLIRAPYFFLAVASKANIGGVASAPVVAAAFHPSLAPVGVLLAVFGYVLGTYGAWLGALLMQGVAPG